MRRCGGERTVRPAAPAARIGQGQAARLLFSAGPIDAAEALRIDLVDLVADPTEIAAQIAANVPAALRSLKRMLLASSDPAQAAVFDAAFASEPFRAAMARYRT